MQLRILAMRDQYEAAKNKPPTRKRIIQWMSPLRNALNELNSGEVDAVKGHPIVKLPWSGELARIDHAFNGFVSLMGRIDPKIDFSAMLSIAKKLDYGIMLTVDEISTARQELKLSEEACMKITLGELISISNTEIIHQELLNKGLVNE